MSSEQAAIDCQDILQAADYYRPIHVIIHRTMPWT
jgi:hypothetical protein